VVDLKLKTRRALVVLGLAWNSRTFPLPEASKASTIYLLPLHSIDYYDLFKITMIINYR
jgi:hypothetical protein